MSIDIHYLSRLLARFRPLSLSPSLAISLFLAPCSGASKLLLSFYIKIRSHICGMCLPIHMDACVYTYVCT